MMFLAASIPDYLKDISIGNAAIVALMGYLVVFFGIVLLMCVIMAMGKIFVAKANKAKAAAQPQTAAAAPVTVTPVAAAPAQAPGTAGQLKLHDVPPKTAAMLMAIVANQMGKPLNELRFISIKEVK